MSVARQKRIDQVRNVKRIKVSSCSRVCEFNIDRICKAQASDLAQKGCFSKFTGSKKIEKEQTLDEVFK